MVPGQDSSTNIPLRFRRPKRHHSGDYNLAQWCVAHIAGRENSRHRGSQFIVIHNEASLVQLQTPVQETRCGRLAHADEDRIDHKCFGLVGLTVLQNETGNLFLTEHGIDGTPEKNPCFRNLLQPLYQRRLHFGFGPSETTSTRSNHRPPDPSSWQRNPATMEPTTFSSAILDASRNGCLAACQVLGFGSGQVGEVQREEKVDASDARQHLSLEVRHAVAAHLGEHAMPRCSNRDARPPNLP
jgi:hypothetical protein